MAATFGYNQNVFCQKHGHGSAVNFCNGAGNSAADRVQGDIFVRGQHCRSDKVSQSVEVFRRLADFVDNDRNVLSFAKDQMRVKAVAFDKECSVFGDGLCASFGRNHTRDFKKDAVIFNLRNDGREDAVNFERLSFFI